MSIINAKDRNTSEISNAMPNVAESVMELLLPVTIVVVQKEQIAGRTEEINIEIDTKASIQPDNQKLAIKTEGQRAWKYWTLYALSNLDLIPDQGFVMDGQGYRVLDKVDWSKYGYFQYSVIEDYQYAPKEEDA